MSPPTRSLPAGSSRADAAGPNALLRRLGRWLGKLPSALAVIVLGVLLGQQYVTPNKRVLPVIAAVLVTGIAWRLDLVTSIGVMIFLLPYPKGTVFGTTNMALALLIAMLWLVNASLRRAPAPRRSPIDLPLVGLVIVYICSFYNVTQPENLGPAFANFETFLSSVLVFYLIIANVNDGRALARVHVFQAVCATTVLMLAVYELKHPGASLFGDWIQLSGSTGVGAGKEFSRHNVRIGASFGDYELLSEFCVLTLLQGVFLWARATSTNQRVLLGGYLVLGLFVMFATVTRGAIVSFTIGVLSLLWMTRRNVRFPALVMGTALLVLALWGMNYYVAHFTTSGDMFARLAKTQFEGLTPESRVGAWTGAWGRIWKHPFIGQGPYYAPIFGFGFIWPHNVYLYYANIVGFIGLGFFLLILWGFFRISRPAVDSLRHPDYGQAYQIIVRAQFIAFAVNEFKIDYLRNSIYQTVVWAMFSVWVATYFVARREQAEAAAAVPAAA